MSRLFQFNGHIKNITVTTAYGGDVRAVVLSKDKKREYTVIIKNYLPDKLPQYNYERKYYISNLIVTCSCNDYMLTRYRSNASIFCIHAMAVFFFFIDNYNMPKIFINPEERITGYAKSDVEEIETDIDVLPLIKFRRYINILLMKNFRNMKNALGISIHTVNNNTDEEDYKPMWLTLTDEKEVKKLIRGLVVVLNKMNGDKGRYVLDYLKPKTRDSVFIESFKRNGKSVKGFYRRKKKKRYTL